MNRQNGSDTPRHPIKLVSRRTGLTADVIRAWERRYHAVEPQRSKTGQRLYSDTDVERLLLLSRVVRAGRRISHVAQLGLEELQALVREDEDAAAQAPPNPPPGAGDALAHLRRCLVAVEQLSQQDLVSALDRASVELSGPNLREGVLSPLLEEIGTRWQDGTLRVAHEHLGTAIVRSFLASSRNGRHLPETAPRMVVTTPAGQLHELGALLVATTAEEMGCRVTYLGPNLPAEEIAAAARQVGAQAVGLSVVYRTNGHQIPDEIRKLRQFLGDSVTVYVGGRAVDNYSGVLEEAGAVVVRDLGSLRSRLTETLG